MKLLPWVMSRLPKDLSEVTRGKLAWHIMNCPKCMEKLNAKNS